MIHLFKELGVTDAERSDAKAKKRAMDEDDGTVVALVSVPGALTAAAILTFISPALEAIAQLRMLRYDLSVRTQRQSWELTLH